MIVSSVLSTPSDGFAVLCVAAIIPWILGIPGDPGNPETNYARSWTLGLAVICVYPLARAVAVAACLGARLFTDATTQARVASLCANCGSLIFLLALGLLARAFWVLNDK